MIHTLRSRIAGRTLELELLIMTCQLLVGLGTLRVGASGHQTAAIAHSTKALGLKADSVWHP